MGIRLASQEDLDWVNHHYKEAGFVPSDLEKELVAIVTYEGEDAGVGRLVQIDENNMEMGGIYILPAFRGYKLADELVSHLVREAKAMSADHVYCLPFEELASFYKKFGFIEADHQPAHHIHKTILAKYNWCKGQYEKNVLLFKLGTEK